MGVTVLGPTGIDGAGELGGRDRTVLCALVVMAGQACPADRLADALYGADPPPTWRKVVQGSVLRLRRRLGAHAVETSAAGYRLAVGDEEIDARRFERLVGQADDLVSLGDWERAALVLRDALELFRGDPLVDLDGWEPGRAEAARLGELRLLAEERRVDALLESGQHREAAVLAASLVERQPLREQRWAALALAQYRAARQGEALRSLQRARRLLAEELGLEPGPQLVELERAILDQSADLVNPTVAVSSTGVCPYRGLASYDVDDADEFFGREAAVQDCLRRLSETGFVAIVGPSGCGKSSLARAGVAPALRRPPHRITVISPGSRPDEAIRAAASDDALVIDQLEELFTLCGDSAERERFVSWLGALATTVPVVVTLRSDHLGSVAELPSLAERVEQGIYLLRPMNEDDLRAAIEGPATRAGLRLEPGLVDLLVKDVLDQPGALPLLSHALTELWARREGRVLTTAAYRAVGGVQGAVSQTAEAAIERLPPEGRRIARELFLRLVSVGDGEPTRLRVARSDVASDAQHAGVLDILTRARLLTVDDTNVQVAHEALVRAWPRLRSWLDEDREGQRLLAHLNATATGWAAMGHDDAELYGGARLRATEDWVAAAKPNLTDTERAFLEASITKRQANEEDLASRAAAQARANSRLRRLLVTVGAALVIALLAGGLAGVQTGRANRERRQAQASTREALLRGLLSEVAGLRATKRDLAALLALAAYTIAPRAETLNALVGTFTAAPNLERTIRLTATHSYVGALLPDGVTYAAVDERQGVRLIDLPSGRQLAALAPAQATGNSDGQVALSPDGHYLALSTGEPGRPSLLTEWDLFLRQRRFPDVTLGLTPGSIAYSPDGRLVAVSGGEHGDTEIHAAADGHLLRSVPGVPRPADASLHVYTAALAFLADGMLAIGSQQGPVRILDPTSGIERRRFAGTQETASTHLLLSPDRRTLFGTGPSGTVGWDVASGHPTWIQSAPGRCDSLAVAALIGALLCGRDDGHVVAFSLATGETLTASFDYQQGPVSHLTVAPAGTLLIATGGPVLELWHLDGTGAISRLIHPGADLAPQEYDNDGRLLLSNPNVGGIPTHPRIVDPATGALLDPLDGIVAATAAAQSPGRLAALFNDGTGGQYDIVHHQRVPGLVIRLPFLPTAVATSGTTLIIYNERRVQGIDPAGHFVPPSFERPAGSTGLGATADGMLFSIEPSGVVPRDRDGQPTGAPALTDVQGEAQIGTLLVLATTDGRLQVLDSHTLRPSGPQLPAVAGITYQLIPTPDGTRLVVVSLDGAVRIADMVSRTFIGDPIDLGLNNLNTTTPNPTTATNNDGTQLALATAHGVIIWDLKPTHLTAAACQVAGRDLTQSEWQQHIGPLARRVDLCPRQRQRG